jgi:hypothetical protein
MQTPAPRNPQPRANNPRCLLTFASRLNGRDRSSNGPWGPHPLETGSQDYLPSPEDLRRPVAARRNLFCPSVDPIIQKSLSALVLPSRQAVIGCSQENSPGLILHSHACMNFRIAVGPIVIPMPDCLLPTQRAGVNIYRNNHILVPHSHEVHYGHIGVWSVRCDQKIRCDI